MSAIHDKNSNNDINEEEHPRFVILLDAYLTDELEALEKEQLEYHLKHCTKCQKWLVDIARMRTLLKPQVVHRQPESMPVSTQQHSPVLMQSVLTGIANDRNNADQLVGLKQPVEISQPVSILRGKKKGLRRHNLKAISMIAAILCLIGMILIFMPRSSQQNNKPAAQPAPIFWQQDEKQTVIRNGSDIFAIKSIEGTSQGFRFFYAFSSLQAEEVPQIEVISLLPLQGGSAINLPMSIHALGKLGTFSVGVIEVPYKNRVGQTIVMQGLSANKTPVWRLTPLKQLAAEPSIANWNFFIEQNNLPEITWTNAFGGQIGIAFFQNTTLKPAGSNAAYLYLRLDNPVRVITHTEFLQLVGKNQDTSACTTCPKPLMPNDIFATATAMAKTINGK